ncbi:MAG: hypothetical protein ACKO0U_12305 [Gammaproteobacteria bacterium]
MTTASPIDSAAQARSRRTLVLLACLFFVPLLVATLLYKTGFGPQGRVNHGELVDPARPLPAGVLVPGKWNLLLVAASCDATCGETLYRTRQVRLLLKGDAERVVRILLTGDATAPLPASARDAGNGLRTASLSGADGAQLDAALKAAAGNPGLRLYLVDPLGNLVLHYPPGFDNAGLLKDLKKLLGLSSIG